MRKTAILTALCALALSACAGTPRQSSNGKIPQALFLCRSLVSNAPAADRAMRVRNFSAYTEVFGIILARAPARGCLSSGFGPRRIGTRSFHKGIDLYTKAPTPIYAAGDGIVEQANTQRGFGRTILIRHRKNVHTRYAHLSTFARGLKPGDRVRLGDQIGLTGDTGNATAIHLHYEILVSGMAKNPLAVEAQ